MNYELRVTNWAAHSHAAVRSQLKIQNAKLKNHAMAKDKDYNRLIHTARWLRLRRDTLTRHPLCQRCEAEGRLSPATEVHHIRPVEEAVTMAEKTRLMYDPHNLRALCHDCHVRTHTEMGRCGREAARRRNEEQARQVIGRFFGDV